MLSKVCTLNIFHGVQTIIVVPNCTFNFKFHENYPPQVENEYLFCYDMTIFEFLLIITQVGFVAIFKLKF